MDMFLGRVKIIGNRPVSKTVVRGFDSHTFHAPFDTGQNITNEFRMGSLVFKGTFGNFKVSVIKKEIQ